MVFDLDVILGLHPDLLRPGLASPDSEGSFGSLGPVSVVFGETDWMDTRGSAKIVENSKFFRDGWSNLYLLQGAGHQMAMDNPKALAEILIKDALGINRKVF